jgi:hypothetical protein
VEVSYVVGSQGDRLGGPAGVPSHQVPIRPAPLRGSTFRRRDDIRQRDSRVEVVVWRGRDDEPDASPLGDGLDPWGVLLGAHEADSAGVLQVVGQLPLLEHDVEGDDDPAGLPDSEVGYDGSRFVLQKDGDPVAPPQAQVPQCDGQGIAFRLEGSIVQGPVKVVNGRTLRTTGSLHSQ